MAFASVQVRLQPGGRPAGKRICKWVLTCKDPLAIGGGSGPEGRRTKSFKAGLAQCGNGLANLEGVGGPKPLASELAVLLKVSLQGLSGPGQSGRPVTKH